MASQWPGEILHLIFTNLMPQRRDAEAYVKTFDNSTTHRHLARVCQVSTQFRRVAEPLLYRRIYNVSFPLIRTLCQRPELSEYIRLIDNQSPSVGNDDETGPKGASATYKNHVRLFIQKTYSTECLELYDNIFAGLKDIEGDCFYDLGFLLLLAVAKNVEVLDWTVNGGVCRTLYRLFEFSCTKLGTIDHTDKREEQNVPLSKVRTIRAPVDTSTGEPWDIEYVNLMPIMYFPRLEEFRTHAVMLSVGADEHDGPVNDDVYTSYRKPPWGSRPNMRHLHLHYTEIDPERGLEDLLRTFPNLQTLELHFGPHECRDPMDFSNWSSTLHRYGKKLRNFYFEPGYDDWEHLEDDDQGLIGSFKDFPHLTQLRVPLVRLIGGAINDNDEEQEVLDLCDVLPKSLKYLWADKTEAGDQSVHDDRVEKLLRVAPERFPDLEFVLTRRPEDAEWSPDGEYWEAEQVNRAVNKFEIYRKRQSSLQSEEGWEDKGLHGARPAGWEMGPWK